jgi:large conductance mechanosensitive channel
MKTKIQEKNTKNKSEFGEFLKNYKVVELAIGVVIGGAVKDLVTSIADDLLMPVIGILSPDGSWRSIVIKLAGSDFKIGNLLGSIVNFLIIATVVFVVIKKILKIDNKK